MTFADAEDSISDDHPSDKIAGQPIHEIKELKGEEKDVSETNQTNTEKLVDIQIDNLE